MKAYGTPLCIDCRNYRAVQKNRGFAAEYVDITENTANLKEFLLMRDTDPVFALVKEKGSIGVPFFVHEDGRKTFDLNEAMAWLDLPPVTEEELPEKRNP